MRHWRWPYLVNMGMSDRMSGCNSSERPHGYAMYKDNTDYWQSLAADGECVDVPVKCIYALRPVVVCQAFASTLLSSSKIFPSHMSRIHTVQHCTLLKWMNYDLVKEIRKMARVASGHGQFSQALIVIDWFDQKMMSAINNKRIASMLHTGSIFFYRVVLENDGNKLSARSQFHIKAKERMNFYIISTAVQRIIDPDINMLFVRRGTNYVHILWFFSPLFIVSVFLDSYNKHNTTYLVQSTHKI